jgi:hypothetical protein
VRDRVPIWQRLIAKYVAALAIEMLDELAASEPDEVGVSVATTVPWKTGGVGAARFRTLAAKDALHDFVRRARGGSGVTHADGGQCPTLGIRATSEGGICWE